MEIDEVRAVADLETIEMTGDGKYEIGAEMVDMLISGKTAQVLLVLDDIRKHLPPPRVEDLAVSSPQTRGVTPGTYSSPTAGSELNV